MTRKFEDENAFIVQLSTINDNVEMSLIGHCVKHKRLLKGLSYLSTCLVMNNNELSRKNK